MPALLYSKRKIRKNMVVTENDINEGNNNTSEVKRFKILIIDDSEKKSRRINRNAGERIRCD